MIILALDTAGVDCAAAVYDSGRDTVLGEASDMIGKGHAEHMIGIVDRALDQAGLALSDIDRLAVTIGPGSFTGIRWRSASNMPVSATAFSSAPSTGPARSSRERR